MGQLFFDKFSMTHFVGGIILERLYISEWNANFFHLLREILEHIAFYPNINYEGTIFEVLFVFTHKYWKDEEDNNCIDLRPILPIEDCKSKGDSIRNIIGDQFFFMIGYKFSKQLSSEIIPYINMPLFQKIVLLPILPLILSLLMANISLKLQQTNDTINE